MEDLILVLVGPSGVGKTTLSRHLSTSGLCYEVVSTTTRKPRPNEEHGVDYIFLTEEEGQKALDNGDFVEHVHYDGNLYGFLKDSFEPQDKPLVLVAEKHGMLQIKEAFPGRVVTFMIVPPTIEDLRSRLEQGGRDPETVERRMATAQAEIEGMEGHYDLRLLSDTKAQAKTRIELFLDMILEERYVLLEEECEDG